MKRLALATVIVLSAANLAHAGGGIGLFRWLGLGFGPGYHAAPAFPYNHPAPTSPYQTGLRVFPSPYVHPYAGPLPPPGATNLRPVPNGPYIWP